MDSTLALTPEEVAERLGLSLDTTYRLLRERRISAKRVGRRYVVPLEGIASFLETVEEETQESLLHQMISLGDLYLRKAQTEGLKEYYALAISKYKKAAALAPADPLPWYQLTRALLLADRESEAKEAFQYLQKAQEVTREYLGKNLKIDSALP